MLLFATNLRRTLIGFIFSGIGRIDGGHRRPPRAEGITWIRYEGAIGFGKESEDLDEGLARIAALADPLTA